MKPIEFMLAEYAEGAVTVAVSCAAFVLLTAAIIGFAITLGKDESTAGRTTVAVLAFFVILVCLAILAVVVLPKLIPVW